MNKIQIKALLLTIIVIGGGAFLLLGKPELNLSSRWQSILAYFESDIDKKETTKGTAKNSKKLKSSGKKGVKVDSYNGVDIFYNGSVGNVSGRNVTSDGYNLGLKYQCVEFVKRFYYKFYNHKMPDSYGHAKDFFNSSVPDGGYNKQRGLTQYSQGSHTKPKVNDLIIFGPTPFNKFGHVAIISKILTGKLEIAQQNPGVGNSSRAIYSLYDNGNGWIVGNQYVKGWLRK